MTTGWARTSRFGVTARRRVAASARPRRAAAPRPRLALIATLTFLVLVILGPLFSLEGQEKGLTGEGNALRQAGYAAVFLLAIGSAWSARGPARLVPIPLSILLALAWCWLSLTWALEPSVALRRLILTTMVIWSVFLMAGQLGYQQTVRCLRFVLIATLVANYVAVIGWPVRGIHQVDVAGDPGLVGGWRGITPHKNFAGQLSAYAIILFALDSRTVTAWLRRGVVVAGMYFLYRSGSKTSAGVLCIALVVAWAYRHYTPRHRPLLVAALLLGVVAAGVAGYAYVDSLAAMLESPDTLTGRIQIWPVLLAYSRDHLMGGSGYGSFWNIGEASPIYQYASGWTTEITSAHNGYLDLLAQIGLPGLLLVIAATMVVPGSRLLMSARPSRQQGALLFALIVFGAGHNLTESTLFDRDTIVNVLLIFAIALITPASLRQSRPRHVAAGNGARG